MKEILSIVFEIFFQYTFSSVIGLKYKERAWKNFNVYQCLSNIKTLKELERISVYINVFQIWKTLKWFGKILQTFKIFQCLWIMKDNWKHLKDIWKSFKVFWNLSILKDNWKHLKVFKNLSKSFNFEKYWKHLKDI